MRSQGPEGSVLTSVNALKYVFDGYYCIKNVVFWLNFEWIFGTFFVLSFNGSHAVSCAYDILDPGPDGLCGGSHFFRFAFYNDR